MCFYLSLHVFLCQGSKFFVHSLPFSLGLSMLALSSWVLFGILLLDLLTYGLQFPNLYCAKISSLQDMKTEVSVSGDESTCKSFPYRIVIGGFCSKAATS